MEWLNIGTLVRPVGIRAASSTVNFAGTAFELDEPGLFLTASHVLNGASNTRDVYVGVDGQLVPAKSIELHPRVDVAALKLELERDCAPLKSDDVSTSQTDSHNLGLEVQSYGYPFRQIAPGQIQLEPRVMHGHIQRIFLEREHPMYEVSFPVVDGQSGSPVISHDFSPRRVVGIVTTSVESHAVLQPSTETYEIGDEGDHIRTRTHVLFGVAVAIWPLHQWMQAVRAEL
ncbi:S1 family peptidase [Candidatus Poriferisodalis sp.]|uniref:S1 family peptidase n=1 Tax=Candidatus Poriferisodalis sp. TaxID=3101277 RepID=UPI003B5A44AD